MWHHFWVAIGSPHFLAYPTYLSQADTDDKLFSFLIKNMRFLPILKSFFKKQSKKIKKLGSKRHSARQNPYSANYPPASQPLANRTAQFSQKKKLLPDGS